MQNRAIVEVLADWQHGTVKLQPAVFMNFHCIGNWKISKEVQEAETDYGFSWGEPRNSQLVYLVMMKW